MRKLRPVVKVAISLALVPSALMHSKVRSAAGGADQTGVALERDAMERVLAPLGNYSRELHLRIDVAVGCPRADKAVFWIVGELAPGQAATEDTAVDLTLAQPDGGPVEATGHATIEKGARTFKAALVPGDALPPDDYVVRARVHGEGSASMATDVLRLTLPAAPGTAGALLFRRGPGTASREVPTADRRFHRIEQIGVEVPVPRATAATARLLDRNGKPRPVPVAAAVREDGDGSVWLTAHLTLAPLAVGDYVIEVTGSGGAGGAGRAGGVEEMARTLVAFRVVQ
jgi:hypothetical protein